MIGQIHGAASGAGVVACSLSKIWMPNGVRDQERELQRGLYLCHRREWSWRRAGERDRADWASGLRREVGERCVPSPAGSQEKVREKVGLGIS